MHLLSQVDKKRIHVQTYPFEAIRYYRLWYGKLERGKSLYHSSLSPTSVNVPKDTSEIITEFHLEIFNVSLGFKKLFILN